MKALGIILTIISTLFLMFEVGDGIIAGYQYSKEYGSYWSLADKASTIPQKAEYVDKFVNALENAGFGGKYNAIFLPTPDKSFDLNLEALKSLQQRLREIKEMNITSFEYQTAIQQITAQEQGEADRMLYVFKGVWQLENNPLIWNWICAVICTLFSGLLIAGIIIWAIESDLY